MEDLTSHTGERSGTINSSFTPQNPETEVDVHAQVGSWLRVARSPDYTHRVSTEMLRRVVDSGKTPTFVLDRYHPVCYYGLDTSVLPADLLGFSTLRVRMKREAHDGVFLHKRKGFLKSSTFYHCTVCMALKWPTPVASLREGTACWQRDY